MGRELQCKAHVKSTGDRCKLPALAGGLVCRFHGGNSPAAKEKASQRIAEREAHEVLIKALADAPPLATVADVYDELLQVAGVTKVWREVLQSRVADLQSLGYAGIQAEQIRADVQLFERALDRSARIGEAIARLNLEERKQALDERTAGLVAQCITAVLNDLELTPEQRLLAKASAPKRLREISA